ncbi:beta-ketoacyl-[acyl-carrier-protein] synthase family protein [Streptomyces sp. NPDC047009]|uniref:beta-ketoacyl-[acyl-carrier-protein] synthase family protein n=1 Tax=Streptomyces sp. NPDC047009 TaxID=3154496 RepID=UPI003406EBC0
MTPRNHREPVPVTGLGVVSPGGIGAATTWRTLSRGLSTATIDDEFTKTDGLRVHISCRVPQLDATTHFGSRTARRLDSFAAFAVIAAREAIADAGLDPDSWDASRVGVVMGVGSSSIESWSSEFARLAAGTARTISPHAIPRSIPSSPVSEIALDLGAQGCTFGVSTACASGGTAIAQARTLLNDHTCDIVVCGGAESFGPITNACFDQLRALSRRNDDPSAASRPFDVDRDGFVLGEGAGVLVLERSADASARGARTRALIAGTGATCDARHPVAPHPSGDGTARAIETALKDAGLTPGDVGSYYAHATSTGKGDLAEAAALRRVFGDGPPVRSDDFDGTTSTSPISCHSKS